nr:DNA polymerase III subunit alpha [Bacilli bacterium]
KSGLTINKIALAMHNNDYYAMGLTDSSGLYGVPEFVNALEGLKKKYIIGLDISIEGDSISLFVYNETGYHNLVIINTALSKGELNFDFIKEHHEGLIAVIETAHGTFFDKFNELDDKEFAKYLFKYNEPFKNDFYLGIEVTSKEGVAYANRVRRFADAYSYPCVAFPRIKYLKKDDAIVLSIVNAISNDEKLNIKAQSGQEYFMSEIDYSKIYSGIEMANTINIVNKSTFSFHQKRGEMLHYDCDNSIQTLKDLCEKAFKEKGLDEEHQKRLDYELNIIITMGYADYFLIVMDYVRWSKNNGVLVGPGRGSAAGSLVAYLLGITEVDPLKYGLQFERFLNPHRQTMPDIDVDFMDTRRDLVVEYMRNKYGKDKVANIVTFQTIMAKQSLRDIGRVYDIPTRHIDLLTKRLTNQKLDLRGSYKTLPEFKKLVDSDKYFLEIVSLASKIENLPRQSGMHAAGIILNNFSLDGAIPVSIDFNDNYISQYEMGYLEEQGFLKMDFLGLRNLTTIARAVELINQNHPDAHLKADEIPYEDKEIFDLIRSGMNMGIFQIETQAMARALKIFKPYCFKDIVALLAIDRPGPSQYIELFSKRNEGKAPITYIDNALIPVLQETNGIILYQEQVNQIAQVFAGFSLAEADLFRRAVSKKDKEKLQGLEDSFMKGAIDLGHSQSVAKKVFDDILKFANYGFNKSHSVVYSIISCRMAYLKIHYPLEFYASILETSSSTDDSKFNEYVSEMKNRDIHILLPDINASTRHFLIKDGGLLYPLTSISGINELLYNKIEHERESNGPFKDFFDFVTRLYPYKINENQILKLIDAGAFDKLYNSRECMRVSTKSALQYAELNYDETGQLSIGISAILPPTMLTGHDDPLENLDKEKEAIGIMISDNPLKYKRDLLDANNVTSIVEGKKSTTTITLCGIIKNKKIIHTKKGSTMAFIKIFDESGEMEVTIFPTVYENALTILEKNNIVLIKGRNDNRNGEMSFLADEVKLLEEEE